MLNESLSYEVPTVRMSAIEALPYLFTEYYQTTTRIPDQNVIINSYIEHIKAPNKVVQMGHLLALGKLIFCMKYS